MQSENPVIQVNASQGRIKMEHYVPLHPQVVGTIQPLLDGRRDDTLMFEYNSFWKWIKRQKTHLPAY